MTNYFTPIDPPVPEWALEQACKAAELRIEDWHNLNDCHPLHKSLTAHARLIEQHEAFKQDVSDAVEKFTDDHDNLRPQHWPAITRFILSKSKPDPLLPQARKLAAQHFEALAVDSIGSDYYKTTAANLRKGAADDTPVVQVVLRTLRWVKENPL